MNRVRMRGEGEGGGDIKKKKIFVISFKFQVSNKGAKFRYNDDGGDSGDSEDINLT